ncbi:uncharacterized protein [Venturia canescens]|uniref:uncharacterized protein n=1 Tax=Venturia canescens TaxID=32260 RepID=UPI001C9C788E|nr:uncharacterized protein LOC122407139 [Venturia canescens]
MAGLTGSLADSRLLLITTFIFFADLSNADDIFLTVNVKKPLALTSDKFLSYTLDPTVVLTGDALTRHAERSVNMARALSPAFVRIGGPRSNSYTFVRPRSMHFEEDPNFTITESNWINVNRWAENAGLDILVCITPQHTEIGGGDSVWDSRNALDLISFSDQMGFNTSWQLGYECQTRCDVTGIDSGKAVMRLRSMLDAFPRYSKSLVTGPDVVAYRTKQQQQYLQDYLSVAGNALSAITWHPNFAGVTLDDEGVSMQYDSLAVDRDSLYRLVGRAIWKKPLWIAESKPEDCKKQFLGALAWTRRLGNAARLGVQVILRQPYGSNLLQPTPDYWVSVLHKALVGPEVLDARVTNGNRSHVHFYCQCTKPSSKYEKGSLTVFGINLTPKKIVVNLKSLKAKTIHKYILLPGFDADNRMFSETVLLNNAPLRLINEQELPQIRPQVLNASKGVSMKLPSGGIGFWVLPGLKIKSCGGLEDDNTDKTLLKRLSKRLEESESEEDNVAGEETNYNDILSMKSNKNRKRSRQYYNGEGESEKHHIKIEAERDLDRLEKMLRKRENHDNGMSMWRGRTSYFGSDDRIPEKRFDGNDFDETSREMREKLKEYKRRLKQYEYKIKRIEPSSRAYVAESEETVDSEKVIDAMKLISKMENAMRKLERDELTNTAILDRHGVSSARRTPSNGRNNRDDTFLDKLLDSKKIKRSSVPSRIEDQLRAIYQMLADERDRRRRSDTENEGTVGRKQAGVVSSTTDRGNFSRPRRDADKKFGVDPLGLRREGLYRRLSRFTDDETKDRRIRRKDERSRDRHAFIIDSEEASDSEEDDFYGFHKREPMRNFPHGDVHLSIGKSEEEPPKDYDYEIDDDGERHSRKMSKGSRLHKTLRAKLDEDKSLRVEVENIGAAHLPIDYFGNFRLSTRPRPRHKDVEGGHSELWEGESISQKSEDTSSPEIDRLVTVEEIVPEQHPDVQNDRRAKDLIVEKLIRYFKGPSAETDEIPDYESTEDFKYRESYERTPAHTMKNRGESNLKVQVDSHYPTQVTPTKHFKRHEECEEKTCLASDKPGNLAAVKSSDFNEPTGASEEKTTSSSDTAYKITDEPANRNKRSTNILLEDALNREMIFQDDNNLKDCDCRVPRSAKAVKRDVDDGKRKRLNRPLTKSLRSSRLGSRQTSPLRKNRKREEKSSPIPAEDEDERQNPRVTRRKRSSESSNDKIESEKTATTDSDRPGSTNGYDSPKNLETPKIRMTKDSPLKNEKVNRTTERRPMGARKAAKRRAQSKSSTIYPQTRETNSEGQESSTPKIELEENKLVTTLTPNTKLSRFRKNRKGAAKELNETTGEPSYSDSTTVPSVGLRSPLYKVNKMASSRKGVTATTNAPPSTAVSQRSLQESTTETEESNARVTEPSKSIKKSANPQSVLSKLRRKMVTTTAMPTIAAATQYGFEADETPKTESPVRKVRKSAKTETTTAAPMDSPIVTATMNSDEKRFLKAKRLELFLQKFLETSSPPVLRSLKNNDVKRSPKLESTVLKETLETTTIPVVTPPENQDEKKSLKPKKAERLEKLKAPTPSPVVASMKNDDEKKSPKSKKAELAKKLDGTTPSPVAGSVKNNGEKKPLKLKKIELQKSEGKSFSVGAPMKSNVGKQSLKSKKSESLPKTSLVGACTKDGTDKQSFKEKTAESLRKLQAKLREKREKLVNEYRKELLSEIDAASEENRNIYRREVMGMMMNEAELRELVDQAKFEYLKHNKPVDYELAEESHDLNETGIIGQKSVPQVQEISKPLHVTQESTATPRTQNIEMSIKPASLEAQPAAKAKNISPRLNDDATNHKIARRDDKPHHENVGSSESMPFYSPVLYGEDFRDGTSAGTKEFVGFAEPFENSAFTHKDKKIMPNYTTENRSDYSDEVSDVDYDTDLFLNGEEKNRSAEVSDELASSKHNSSDDGNKLLRNLKGKNPYEAINDDTRTTEAEHTSKKRYLTSSDFDREQKYESPKYARLFVDRRESLPGDKIAVTVLNDRESKGKVKSIGTKNLEKKNIEAGGEKPSWIVKRLKDDYQENHSAMINYADLDEALNSGDYELVMLIPVNDSQRKIRQKRNVRNQITRDLGISAAHDVIIDILPKNEKEDATIDHADHNVRTNEIVSEDFPRTEILNHHERDDHSMGQYLIPAIDRKLKMSEERDVKILANKFLKEEETVPFIPDTHVTLEKKSPSDEELPDVLKEALSKPEVNGGLGEAQRISESLEKFIDDFEDKLATKRDNPNKNVANIFPISSDILGTTVTNVKKLFNFLSGLVQVFRAN